MYLVEWLQSALDELARLWLVLDSAGRRAITGAANQIDLELVSAPGSIGESRFGNVRIHYVRPLGLNFEVDAINRVVRVVNVWFVKQSGP